MFLLGAICGVIVMGGIAVAMVRHEARKPWWRSRGYAERPIVIPLNEFRHWERTR